MILNVRAPSIDTIDTKPSLRTDFLIRDKEFSHLALLIFSLISFNFVLYKSTVVGSFHLKLYLFLFQVAKAARLQWGGVPCLSGLMSSASTQLQAANNVSVCGTWSQSILIYNLLHKQNIVFLCTWWKGNPPLMGCCKKKLISRTLLVLDSLVSQRNVLTSMNWKYCIFKKSS